MTKRYRVRWTETALADIDSILRYVAAHADVETAIKLYEKLIAGGESLASIPTRCRRVPELAQLGVTHYRERLVSPYRIAFRIRGREVGIISVLDGRRDLEQLLFERATNTTG